MKALYNVQNIEGSLTQLFSRSIVGIIGKEEASTIIEASKEELAKQVLETMNGYIQNPSYNFIASSGGVISEKGKDRERETQSERMPIKMSKTDTYKTFKSQPDNHYERSSPRDQLQWGGRSRADRDYGYYISSGNH